MQWSFIGSSFYMVCTAKLHLPVSDPEQVFDKVDDRRQPLDGGKVKSITVVPAVLDPNPHFLHLCRVGHGVDQGGLPVVADVVRPHRGLLQSEQGVVGQPVI